MVVNALRLARLQKGLTLDDVHLLTKGQLSPARLSRIERGFCKPTEEESRLLIELFGVTEETIAGVFHGPESHIAGELRPATA